MLLSDSCSLTSSSSDRKSASSLSDPPQAMTLKMRIVAGIVAAENLLTMIHYLQLVSKIRLIQDAFFIHCGLEMMSHQPGSEGRPHSAEERISLAARYPKVIALQSE